MSKQAVYDERRELLYCSEECALKDGSREEDLEPISERELADEDDDRFWYDGELEPGIRMPMFGHTCCEDECDNFFPGM